MARGKLGAALGLLAGAAIGVLFAPKRGKELRRRIKSEIDKGGSGFGPVKRAIKGMGDDITDTCKGCYESDEVKKAVRKGKTKAKKTLGKAKQQLSKAEKSVKRKLKTRKTRKKK